jgi:formate dehydrogenase maturation protein FdhE
MTTFWDAAIARADALAGGLADEAVLQFIAALLRLQRRIYTRVQTATVPHTAASGLSGDLAVDLPLLRSSVPLLLDLAASQGPEPLAREAADLRLAAPKAIDQLLIDYWRRAPGSLIAKAMVQPYARALADVRIKPAHRDRIQPDQRCPFCGGLPQLAILQQGGTRQLQCATCLTVWPLQRTLCPQCGEQDERRLGYFHAADSAFPHVRVEVCATCAHYLKAVDISILEVAVPIVDEIAASPLDTWAREQGLTKIERNLAGL